MDQNKKNSEIAEFYISLSTTKRLVKWSLGGEFEDVSHFQSSSDKKGKWKSRITLKNQLYLPLGQPTPIKIYWFTEYTLNWWDSRVKIKNMSHIEEYELHKKKIQNCARRAKQSESFKWKSSFF